MCYIWGRAASIIKEKLQGEYMDHVKDNGPNIEEPSNPPPPKKPKNKRRGLFFTLSPILYVELDFPPACGGMSENWIETGGLCRIFM